MDLTLFSALLLPLAVVMVDVTRNLAAGVAMVALAVVAKVVLLGLKVRTCKPLPHPVVLVAMVAQAAPLALALAVVVQTQ
jgi:hypothetical protein